jgi:hypothetical protein
MVTINLKEYYELYTILKKIERALDLYIGSFVSMTKIQVQMRPCCRMHVCLMIWRWGVAINMYRHAINWQRISKSLYSRGGKQVQLLSSHFISSDPLED